MPTRCPRPCRELEAPDARKHRAVVRRRAALRRRIERRSVESYGDDECRNLGEVLDEELSRVDHLLTPVVSTDLGVRREVRPTDGSEPFGDLGLEVLVGDDQPTVAFEVAAHRGVVGDLDDLQQGVVRDRPCQVEPLANLLGGGQQSIDLVEVEAGRGMGAQCQTSVVIHTV